MPALLLTEFHVPAQHEDEWSDWYLSEHLPRVQKSQPLLVKRLVRDAAPRHLEVRELTAFNGADDTSSAWSQRMLRTVKLKQLKYEQVSAPGTAAPADHALTVLRTMPLSERARAEQYVKELSARAPAITARLFASPTDLLVYCTAVDEQHAQAVLAADLAGTATAFRTSPTVPRDDERYTQTPDDPRATMRDFHRRGYTDGLPVIPPTPDLVAEMIASQRLPARHVLGKMAPRQGEATVEALAVNAVMAGCYPEYFPVIVAAVEALLDPAFNLPGVQATTHPVTPMVIVNGPMRLAIDLGRGHNAMGEGTHANATIGRAIRLILRNVGGAVPGKSDLTTQGSPARYSFVVADDEEAYAFPPLHVALGFKPTDSVVTVCGTEGPHNVNDHSSQSAECFLQMLCGTMATLGTNDLGRGGRPVIILGPEHAKMLVRDGFTRETVQRYVFENARVRVEHLPKDLIAWFNERKTDIDQSVWSDRGVPLASRPENILVLCAGGAGRHSCFAPSFGFCKPVSVAIRDAPTSVTQKIVPSCDC